MSVFKRILAEKKGRDYSKKGPMKVTRSKTISSKKLGTETPRVIKAPDGSLTITNMPEPSGSVTTDQVIDTADQKAKNGSPRGSG